MVGLSLAGWLAAQWVDKKAHFHNFRPSEKQLSALDECQCSGEVDGQPHSFVELDVCGRLQ